MIHKEDGVIKKICASHVPIEVLICPRDSFRENVGHFFNNPLKHEWKMFSGRLVYFQ